MRYLSLFSGIEAATSAWHPLGWQCVGVSDIDTFACEVLKHRYPHVPNLGDVTTVTEAQIAALGQVDVVVFGSPCQDLSVAGKRKGLDGARSGLFFTAIRIVEYARRWCGCRFALWENVPGAFSSNEGRDFAAVVEHLAGIDTIAVPPKGWGNEGAAVGTEALVEWSTLDAQWFGVAQRRRRVFALADFGDWANRPPVLLEPQSLRGDSAPRREAGQSVTPAVTAGAPNGGPGHGSRSGSAKEGLIVPHIVGTLSCNSGPNGHDAGNFSCNQGVDARHILAVVFDTTQITSKANYSNPRQGDPCHPLAAGAHAPAIAFPARLSGTQHARAENLAPSIGAANPTAIAYSTKLHNTSSNQAGKVYEEYTTSLDANSPPPALLTSWAVRRLTPVECERLQGFPDHHTAIPWRRKPSADCPDGPRYKALGNSMAVPVMHWIGQRIDFVVRWF